MDITDITKRREAVAAELAAIDAQLYAEKARLRETVKREWRFTLTPSQSRDRSWLEIRDPAVVPYTLRGEVTNREARAAAGHSER